MEVKRDVNVDKKLNNEFTDVLKELDRMLSVDRALIDFKMFTRIRETSYTITFSHREEELAYSVEFTTDTLKMYALDSLNLTIDADILSMPVTTLCKDTQILSYYANIIKNVIRSYYRDFEISMPL